MHTICGDAVTVQHEGVRSLAHNAKIPALKHKLLGLILAFGGDA